MERMERIEGEYIRRDGANVSRNVVPGGQVQVIGGSARVGIPGRHAACAPQIELIRTGEVIEAIDVTCTCGQKIRLRCVYETAGTLEPRAPEGE